MKRTKTKALILMLGLIFLISLCIGIVTSMRSGNISANAETALDESNDDFIVEDYGEIINATYDYTVINDTECSVRILNKTIATKAVIPSRTIIDGKEYKVTEIDPNGFISSTKLVRVSLPSSIKKVGNLAFANCPELKRVSLANVKELGNSVFYRCPKLEELIIPESVTTVGTYILRNNNTQVRLRAEAVGPNWATNWNNNNSNQNIEFNSKYVQPLELEPIYNNNPITRSIEVDAYTVASGQPRTDSFYGSVYQADFGEDPVNTEREKDDIFIPAQFNGKEIRKIENGAFEGVYFDHLVVEYSDKDIILCPEAFLFATGNSITFNRSISYFDEETNVKANNIFTLSTVTCIILPDSIDEIVDEMFNSCEQLQNIIFITPQNIETREEMLDFVSNKQSQNEEGVVHLPGNSQIKAIGASAFSSAVSITELHLDDSIKTIGLNIISYWDTGKHIDDDGNTKDNQAVYVHNNEPLPDSWDEKWNANFPHIYLDNYFYKIFLDPTDGELDQEFIYALQNSTISEVNDCLPVPTLKNYIFAGWFTEEGEQYTLDTVYLCGADITLTAQWNKKPYYITLDNGDGDKNIITVYYGEPLPYVDIPTSTGCIFKGYYTDTDIRYYDDEMNGIRNWESESDITLYAKWEKIPYTIVFEKEGGKGGTSSVVVYYGCEMSNAIAPSREGYTFDGYFIDSIRYYNNDMSSAKNWDIADNKELYAHWINNPYTISFDKKNGTDGSDYVIAYFDKEMPIAEAPTMYGKDFLGYYYTDELGHETKYYNNDMSSANDWNIPKDVVLYAKWATHTSLVTLDHQGGSKGSDSVNATFGQPMPAAIPPVLNYGVFDGYFDQPKGDGNRYYYKDMTSARNMDTIEDITLYANYIFQSFEITYELGDGLNTMLVTNHEDNPMEITFYDTITLKDPSRLGYKFEGWYLNDVQVSCLSEIHEDIILVARWKGTEFTENETYYNIKDDYSIIYFYRNTNILAEYTIKVSAEAKQLCITSSLLRSTYLTMSIEIENRADEFTLILDSVKFTAPSGKHAILMKSDKMLNLYSYYSAVQGSDRLDLRSGSTPWQQGSSAIYCKHLTIHTAASLKGGSQEQGFMGNKYFHAGVAVSLAEGGTITIKGKNVNLYGGDALGLNGGAYGYPIYANNENYQVFIDPDVEESFNRKNGYGSQPYNPPYIGY